MTKKDYKLIAGVLNRALKEYEDKSDNYAIRIVSSMLVGELMRDNPRFDSTKFVDAVLDGVKAY